MMGPGNHIITVITTHSCGRDILPKSGTGVGEEVGLGEEGGGGSRYKQKIKPASQNVDIYLKDELPPPPKV